MLRGPVVTAGHLAGGLGHAAPDAPREAVSERVSAARSTTSRRPQTARASLTRPSNTMRARSCVGTPHGHTTPAVRPGHPSPQAARLLHPKQVTKWFNQHVTSAGLPPIRLHDVRHSYATVALSNREPITVVSRRLGHAKVSITLDVYSHILPTDDGETASRVASIILGA
jgi:integrase